MQVQVLASYHQEEKCMLLMYTIESQKPLENEIFLVKTPSDDILPTVLFILLVVLPSSAVEKNKCKLLTRRAKITIPAGTIVAHVFPTDTVTVAYNTPTKFKSIQSCLVDSTRNCLREEMSFLWKNGMWD